jgi:OPA family glycerol-3-phosphate transporter-like MFS transporter 1/2
MQEAGNLSILFDVGGVAGGALAGALSDAASAPACVSAAFVFGSVPFM